MIIITKQLFYCFPLSPKKVIVHYNFTLISMIYRTVIFSYVTASWVNKNNLFSSLLLFTSSPTFLYSSSSFYSLPLVIPPLKVTMYGFILLSEKMSTYASYDNNKIIMRLYYTFTCNC